MASGSHPFRQFVLKLSSRCDLACRYCYVYTKADQRWRARPKAMPRDVVTQAAKRIAEHAARHRLGSVEVIMHGGEPLLAGADRIKHCARTLHAAAGHGLRMTLRMQTNGTLLDRRMLTLLDEQDIQVGVSVDGDRQGHDRHRLRADGSGSHALVDRALRELGQPEHRRLFSGLLCTVDLRNDPVATYEALLAYRPPAVDFLLPHGNWSNPPPHRRPDPASTPYADWLIAVFDRWRTAPRLETRVRTFEEIMRLLLGGQSRVEGLGLSPTAVVIVETDGAIEQSDVLATSYPSAAATGLQVDRDSFDDALSLPGFTARQAGLAALGPTCRSCHAVQVCGGGFYPHRYRAGHGYSNPSVYCPDLYRLIRHCADRMARELRPSGSP
jgi:uncharacterized protein